MRSSIFSKFFQLFSFAEVGPEAPRELGTSGPDDDTGGSGIEPINPG